MENLAIHICHQIFNGKKAEEGKYRSIDLIFERDNKLYIVGIKSGPNWGNSDQVNTMKRNFKLAKRDIRINADGKPIIAVNGCMYGKDNKPHKVSKDPALAIIKFVVKNFGS
ncbi:MAG: methylase N-4/N-6 domain protein [Parcubacteria group bacterium GW2011_GWA2_43_9b]|nr:MAG: methylase N-4/N-6 domain protein [Parcubacteria group bacterium GW2011_GWA2_43_9b]